MKTLTLHVFQGTGGKTPFASWFHKLERVARSKVSAALFQMEEGNFSDSKYVSKGIWERRIHSGPGYRVYFAKLRRQRAHSARWRHQADADFGHPSRASALGGLYDFGK